MHFHSVAMLTCPSGRQTRLARSLLYQYNRRAHTYMQRMTLSLIMLQLLDLQYEKHTHI
jgi:hypothetical protein